MAWKSSVTVKSIDGNVVTASGTATGTDDDSTIQHIDVELTYSSVPEHLVLGGTMDLEADC